MDPAGRALQLCLAACLTVIAWTAPQSYRQNQ